MNALPTTERPRLLVTFSLIAFLVVVIIGVIAFLDQNQRIKDPSGYADRRCKASFLNASPTPSEFASCVTKEEKKSTLASIYPLFVTGVIVSILGVSGLVVGRSEVRKKDERRRRLHGV
ncbi:MAG: hypothetical protein ACXVQY_06950 [Actinomycetota bacterium]